MRLPWLPKGRDTPFLILSSRIGPMAESSHRFGFDWTEPEEAKPMP